MKGLENHSLGKYRLIRPVGRGAMATVYFARDTFTERDVAIKVANPDDKKASAKRLELIRKLFYNEAKAAALLRHPNIIRTLDAGDEEGIRYIVMEYVNGGGTLYSHCKPHALLPIEDVVDIIGKCAGAFDYAHRKGVIHRDVKPRNILLTADHDVKLVDFGVAMLTGDYADTQVQGQLGSPLYMSPEQLRGEQITSQSDLFSLGLVLFEMLTGVHPFAGTSVEVVSQKIAREAYTPLETFRDDVPTMLVRIIDRLLKKHPAGRYQSGLDLAGDLSLVYDHINECDEQLSMSQKMESARQLRFFSKFSEPELQEVVGAGLWQQFEAGTEIVQPKASLRSLYVIVDGDICVLQDGVEVEALSRHSCFGDIGAGQRPEAPGRVVAGTDVTLLKLKSVEFDRFSDASRSSLERAYLRTAAERLSRATQIIANERLNVELEPLVGTGEHGI
ncbi:MAG: protein kinase [Pseudomonadota bacterium]